MKKFDEKYFAGYDEIHMLWEPEPGVEADYAVWTGNMPLFLNCLKELTDKQIETNIDTWIETAIAENQCEFTVFLLDYKEKHNLYTETKWDL